MAIFLLFFIDVKGPAADVRALCVYRMLRTLI
jgi:hypothetical protein